MDLIRSREPGKISNRAMRHIGGQIRPPRFANGAILNEPVPNQHACFRSDPFRSG